MRGKGSISHSEGCCTGYIGLEEAVFAVASGAYDVVLTGCSEQGTGMSSGGLLMKITLIPILASDLSCMARSWGLQALARSDAKLRREHRLSAWRYLHMTLIFLRK